jgi:hypothetical protein
MSSDHGRRLLARAHQLADAEDLAEEVTGILGGGRSARIDPDALRGLAQAALALGADSLTVYRAEGPAYSTDSEFTDAVAEAEAKLAGRVAAVARLTEEAGAALDDAEDDLEAARADLARAQAMPVSRPCDGCHPAREAAITAARAAIADASDRAGYARDAIGVLAGASGRLRTALKWIRRVPGDLADTYEAVYDHVRAGRVMPQSGDFLAGAAS